ncbi:histone family protein nucleoid-structuring protein H-NS [Caballeronia arvi]|uniref:Histone family protein nucleoid-structuring protein H-NS n=1 Tax=Caballeronia arvi TaxID=1777135 RepID=A0A158JSI7_9BURK|nr:H-NS family nucleoid-associated regulatory protein [Caballeronia arvi]SAL71655.1 histone family protein nucleoid-structuring protein H-NS [Caballeronia arvi]
MATLESIQAKIAKLQAQAETITKKQSAGVIAQIHSLMSKHGISMEDLSSEFGGKNRGTKMASKSSSVEGASNARYQDPKSGATWSGHGRAPGWIAGARNRDKFLIDGSSTSTPPATNPAAKNAAKPGNYLRGPQPALYRDPKSGAEWSGRGRAPAWLASAKNRDRFLIGGNATTAPIADRSSAKPGNYVRGKQPAMYRDPKSGAEWSGRGKAPAWLAGARDRTKFLIDVAAAKAGATESTPKAVTAKKAAAKKATATVSAKKGAAKRASPTSAKTPGGKGAAAKKSISAAKKGARVGSKKAAAKKVGTKGAAGKVAAENAPDAATSLPGSSSDASAVISVS